MSLTVRIRGDASQFEKTMRGVKSSIGGLSTAIGGAGAATAVAGLAAGFVAVGKAVEFIKSSSEKAANIESLTMQFETLLGSADAAQKRMAEIAKFAETTPFEIAELSATSKLLQTMGGNLLATGEGLRMVGDAAAISGQPLEEIGLHIGRVFNAITSGTSAGESVGRLQELGLITGTVKREFEDLADAQKKGKAPIMAQAEALAKLKGILSATEGAMLRLADTTQGKLSNMQDNVSKLQVAFGKGFNEGLKDALDAANTFLPQLEKQFADSGEFLGMAISDAVAGDPKKFELIGNFIGELIIAGMKASVLAGLSELGENIGKGITKMPSLIGLFNAISGGKVAEGLESATKSETTLGAEFARAAQSPGLYKARVAINDAINDTQATGIANRLGQGFNQNLTQPMMAGFGQQGMNYAARDPFAKQETITSAVSDGVLRAFSKKPQVATFSN